MRTTRGTLLLGLLVVLVTWALSPSLAGASQKPHHRGNVIAHAAYTYACTAYFPTPNYWTGGSLGVNSSDCLGWGSGLRHASFYVDNGNKGGQFAGCWFSSVTLNGSRIDRSGIVCDPTMDFKIQTSWVSGGAGRWCANAVEQTSSSTWTIEEQSCRSL